MSSDSKAHLYPITDSDSVFRHLTQCGDKSLPELLAPHMSGVKGKLPSRLWRTDSDSDYMAVVTHQFPDELVSLLLDLVGVLIKFTPIAHLINSSTLFLFVSFRI